VETAGRPSRGSRRVPCRHRHVGQGAGWTCRWRCSRDELGAVCTHEQWAEDLRSRRRPSRRPPVRPWSSREHNGARGAGGTRVHLAEPLGQERGGWRITSSLSRQRRFTAEAAAPSPASCPWWWPRLARASASTVGARWISPASWAPRASIATGLQRIGAPVRRPWARLPKGRLFPLTRDQLIVVRGPRAGGAPRRDRPHRHARGPPDVLASRSSTACAAQEWDEDHSSRSAVRPRPMRR